MPRAPVVATEHLHCSFGAVSALTGITIEVDEGEFVGLVGPSGAGKSTLLRALNGFVTPSRGRVVVVGRDVAALKGAVLRRHRADVGMVYQQFHLVGRASALSNATAGSVSRQGVVSTCVGRVAATERRRAAAALDRVGLLDKWDQRTSTLSGGQQQRVAIARTLVQDPRLVLADEPVASLDPGSSSRVLGLLRSLAHDDGRTVLASLHQVEYARQFCDRVIALDQGALVLDSPPAEVTDQAWNALYQLAGDKASEPEQRLHVDRLALR